MLTRDQAIARLSDYCQAEMYPELDSADLGTLIDRYKRFTVWASSTAYNVGDCVIPPIANGRKYYCAKAGTSGTDTTIFPDYGITNTIVTDGADINWQDGGPVGREQYDVMSSARAAWLMKASRVSNLIGTQDGQQRIDSQNLQAHFLEMSNKFRPMEII